MKITFILLIILKLVNGGFAQDNLTVDRKENAYNFIGIDQNGNEVSIDTYKGKYVLLNFTATFCSPCWSTYNQMSKFQDEYITDLKVISFHYDNEKEAWQKIADKHQIKFECTSIWEAENKSKISEIYQVDGFPYFFLIDRNGIILKKWFGDRENRLERVLRRYCKQVD